MARTLLTLIAASMLAAGAAVAQIAGGESAPTTDAAPGRVEAAHYLASGQLAYPADLDQWVFLGTSLGMGYSQVRFNPGTPGNFQVVQIEPNAYREFLKTGTFPEGTMIALSFYSAVTGLSINKTGFVGDRLEMVEIHVKDRARFPSTGFNFFMFHPGDKAAAALPLPNDCVTCHVRDGAHDAFFTQFYPLIRDKVRPQTH